ncbi:DNA cytosine methyltransferase [Changchengzhania lutea]|uniref:DNA cytosine methyltransferase n=1 Tax=Changchengzhania lutea TaxID=2049305 RepID=UPI0021D24D63|nr:DNA (cytosine-5-)-methyltransferase [Changchengzhania lutea]
MPKRRGGFENTRGTLFFDVAEIIKKKQPKAIFLENVKGLRNHDKGKTLATILNVLREDLNYYVPEPQILNAKEFGVPQNRERIFIVVFLKDLGVTLKGRAIRCKSSLVPRCGLFTSIPNAA